MGEWLKQNIALERSRPPFVKRAYRRTSQGAGPSWTWAIRVIEILMDAPALPHVSPRPFLVALCLGCAALPQMASAQDIMRDISAEGSKPAEPDVVAATGDQIGFSAAVVEYDSNTEIVTAKGDVIVNRDGYTMRADNVV